MKNDLQMLRLFSPLFPYHCRRNQWGDYEFENETEELTGSEVLEYERDILALIEKERMPCESEQGLAIYIHDEALSQKISSIFPTVEQWNNELWCVTEVKTHEPLSAAEYARLTDFLTGQYADGWGEGFEQRAIKVDEGEMYVSLWAPCNRFCFTPEEEMPSGQSLNSAMGGM